MEKLTEEEYGRLLKLALDIGESMLRSGAEISRVEDTVVRICLAYKVSRVDVFSITSLIVASLQTGENTNITQSRRIYSYTSNFDLLEKLNSLSRKICETTPDVSEADAEYRRVINENRISKPMQCIGSALCAGAFAMFYGGNLLDGVAALLIGSGMFFIDLLFMKVSINKIVQTLISSIFAGTAALLLVGIGLGANPDKIMIGNVMLLIPGIAIVNSVRDMLCGDTMAGLLRLIEALIIAVAITVGFALPIIVRNML